MTTPADVDLVPVLSGWASQQVVELMGRARNGWPFLSTLLEETFKRDRTLPREKGPITRALMDWVRFQRAALFAVGGDDSPEHQMCAALILAGSVPVDAALEWVHPDLRAGILAFEARVEKIADPVERFGTRHSLPDWLAQLLLDELGAERAESVARALNHHPPQVLRANLLKGTREETMVALRNEGYRVEPTRHVDTGVQLLSTQHNIFVSTAYSDGRVEMQDEASQIVATLVAPPPGSLVVDWCAGAGGKTLALGALMNNKGHVMALDVHDKRLEELRKRARRADLSNVEARVLTDDTPPIRAPGAARVLVDAPCTGLGALRRNPEARWRLVPADLPRLAEQQFNIASRALQHVAPGGRLVYATCSFARAEGEEVVARLRAAHPRLVPVTAREVLGRARSDGLTDESGTYLRTWPDMGDMDGFFGAVLRVPA